MPDPAPHRLRHSCAVLALLLVTTLDAVTVPAAVAGATATANAADVGGQFVFDHGDELRAAHADGSHAHVLVTARQVGGDHLGEPATSPAGNVLAVHRRSDTDKTVSSHDRTFWGRDHMRTFELHDGHLTALSTAPGRSNAALEADDLAPGPTWAWLKGRPCIQGCTTGGVARCACPESMSMRTAAIASCLACTRRWRGDALPNALIPMRAGRSLLWLWSDALPCAHCLKT